MFFLPHCRIKAKLLFPKISILKDVGIFTKDIIGWLGITEMLVADSLFYNIKWWTKQN